MGAGAISLEFFWLALRCISATAFVFAVLAAIVGLEPERWDIVLSHERICHVTTLCKCNSPCSATTVRRYSLAYLAKSTDSKTWPERVTVGVVVVLIPAAPS